MIVDIMIPILYSDHDLKKMIAAQAKSRRLSLSLTQEGLATRSGVSLGTLKLFERTGKISLESLLKLAIVLGTVDEFKSLFEVKLDSYTSLKQLMKESKKSKRGTIK